MLSLMNRAANGNELLAVLESFIDTETDDDSWFTDPNSKASYHHYWLVTEGHGGWHFAPYMLESECHRSTVIMRRSLLSAAGVI